MTSSSTQPDAATHSFNDNSLPIQFFPLLSSKACPMETPYEVAFKAREPSKVLVVGAVYKFCSGHILSHQQDESAAIIWVCMKFPAAPIFDTSPIYY